MDKLVKKLFKKTATQKNATTKASIVFTFLNSGKKRCNNTEFAANHPKI